MQYSKDQFVKSMSIPPVDRKLIAGHLLKIVLADKDTASRCSEELSTGGYWPRTLQLAKMWRVVPQLKNRIDTLCLPMDPHTSIQLREAHIESSAHSMMALHICRLMFREFNNKQLRAVAFKGVGVISSLYQGPTDRSMNDIDILVRREDFDQAYRTLRTLDFAPIVDRLVQYVDFLEGNELLLTNDDGFEVDLHIGYDGSDESAILSAERIIAHAQTADIWGASVHVPSLLDSMMITVQHSLHHNFDPTESVRDMCDLRRWWCVYSKTGDIEEVVSQVGKFRLLEPWLALWMILSKLDSSGGVASLTEQLKVNASVAEQENAQRLRGLFEYRLGSTEVSCLLLRIMAEPLAIGRYLASRAKKGPMNIHALPNRQRRQTVGELILNEVSLCAREVFGLNARRLGFYRALVSAHMKHQQR